jgi:hypothetical protein
MSTPDSDVIATNGRAKAAEAALAASAGARHAPYICHYPTGTLQSSRPLSEEREFEHEREGERDAER